MFFLYTLISICGHLLLAPYFLLRTETRRKYLPSFRQRCGWHLPASTPPGKTCLWVHTVSMGELLAARRFIQRLKEEYPQARLVISTITLTGNALARKHFPDLDVFFFPLDWGPVIRRFLSRLRPNLFLSVETEIWPNFYRLAHRHGCRIALVNGRISPPSYRHYRWMRTFFLKIAEQVDLFLMQSPDNRERLCSLGVPKKKIVLTGNLKYDLRLETDPAMEKTIERMGKALQVTPTTPVLVCGSTMPGEEPMILEWFSFLRQRLPSCRLVLAPRHPERFSEVADLLSLQPFRFHRRSLLNDLATDKTVDILLLDSIGELAHVYRISTLVFIGGSLVDYGGHNILEPAFLGKAIFFGPHMRNFQDIADTFLRSQGACQVQNLEELKGKSLEVLENQAVREALGQKAAGVMRENGGAVEKSLQHVRSLM